jgi:hypothetical protein
MPLATGQGQGLSAGQGLPTGQVLQSRYRELARLAEAYGTSLNQLVLALLSEGVGRLRGGGAVGDPDTSRSVRAPGELRGVAGRRRAGGGLRGRRGGPGRRIGSPCQDPC